MAEERMKNELTTLGRAYGKSANHLTPFLPPISESGPNMLGNELTGSARKPPKIGPITTPENKSATKVGQRDCQSTDQC